MHVQKATSSTEWDAYLASQWASPFLQSWTMGEVYEDVGEKPIRLEVRENNTIVGICQAFIVPARRGRHLSVPYGPVTSSKAALEVLLQQLSVIAKESNCLFVRLSPFVVYGSEEEKEVADMKSISAPLHLLAEHIWHIPLKSNWQWNSASTQDGEHRDEEKILMSMRKTTRNLVRRAEREGVIVEASQDHEKDMPEFIRLHDETRKRHKFTPYSNDFFRAQVKRFHALGQCTLYIARYQGEVLASSVHMHFGGETSYHHGASSMNHPKIPASSLLQWTAIKDALQRKDSIYSFWGIAPEGVKKHPFSGVTTFKRGFGGELLEIMHCRDIPVNWKYGFTYAFETARKIKRGF